MPYVISTLSNSQEYTQFLKPEIENGKVARPATPQKSVLIKGGANVQGVLRTPEGVITQVTDDEVELLRSIPMFVRQEKRGMVKIVQREMNPDKIAAKDMEARDESSPLNEAHGDFKPGGRAGGEDRAPDQAPLKVI